MNIIDIADFVLVIGFLTPVVVALWIVIRDNNDNNYPRP